MLPYPNSYYPNPMKTHPFTLLLSSCLIASAVNAQTTFLSESFVAVPTGTQGPGEYREDVSMNNPSNDDVAGGTIVGFSASNLWGTNSGNPRPVATGLNSTSVASSGGSHEFRGASGTNQRYISRDIDAYAGPGTIYFSGSLSTNLIDDNMVSLIAFSSSGIQSRANAFLDNSGDFYNGFAVGFHGDGSGGVDLVVRYRDSSLAYVEGTLQSGIVANDVYTISGSIEWDVVGSPGNTRDQLSIWVNPENVSEPGAADFSQLAVAGDANTLSSLLFAQQDVGTGLTDAVYMDEIRLGDSWSALTPIPEPAHAVSFVGLGAVAFLFLRRRKI